MTYIDKHIGKKPINVPELKYKQHPKNKIKKDRNIERFRVFTIFDMQYKSESQRIDKLEEERLREPRLVQPSTFRLVRHRLSATNRPNSSLRHVIYVYQFNCYNLQKQV